jgi:hypothetical protein
MHCTSSNLQFMFQLCFSGAGALILWCCFANATRLTQWSIGSKRVVTARQALWTKVKVGFLGALLTFWFANLAYCYLAGAPL